MNIETRSARVVPHAPAGRSEAGFTLVELLTGMVITAMVLLLAFLLFDVNTRVGRVQGDISDMQQSQRIAHNDLVKLARMAGRGTLPLAWALAYDDNVDLGGGGGGGGGTQVGGQEVVDGTDILTVRGVFSSPIYQVNHLDDTTATYDDGQDRGTIQLSSNSPTGVFQSLEALDDAEAGEAILLVSPVDEGIYAVVELRSTNFSSGDQDGDGTVRTGEGTLQLQYEGAGDPDSNAGRFLAMSTGGTLQDQLEESVAFVAILEEYRFYIRDDQSAASGAAPKLTRARFYPNTETIHPSGSATDDIADNIIDLQVVRGLDRDNDGIVDENPDDTNDDDWLYNDPADDETDAEWAGRALLNLRLTTVARTDLFDRGYQADALTTVENHAYNEPDVPADADQSFERSFRRRVQQTVVDLRNFS